MTRITNKPVATAQMRFGNRHPRYNLKALPKRPAAPSPHRTNPRGVPMSFPTDDLSRGLGSRHPDEARAIFHMNLRTDGSRITRRFLCIDIN